MINIVWYPSLSRYSYRFRINFFHGFSVRPWRGRPDFTGTVLGNIGVNLTSIVSTKPPLLFSNAIQMQVLVENDI